MFFLEGFLDRIDFGHKSYIYSKLRLARLNTLHRVLSTGYPPPSTLHLVLPTRYSPLGTLYRVLSTRLPLLYSRSRTSSVNLDRYGTESFCKNVAWLLIAFVCQSYCQRCRTGWPRIDYSGMSISGKFQVYLL